MQRQQGNEATRQARRGDASPEPRVPRGAEETVNLPRKTVNPTVRTKLRGGSFLAGRSAKTLHECLSLARFTVPASRSRKAARQGSTPTPYCWLPCRSLLRSPLAAFLLRVPYQPTSTTTVTGTTSKSPQWVFPDCGRSVPVCTLHLGLHHISRDTH